MMMIVDDDGGNTLSRVLPLTVGVAVLVLIGVCFVMMAGKTSWHALHTCIMLLKLH